jgi:CHASE2 domain-containing sensor protein
VLDHPTLFISHTATDQRDHQLAHELAKGLRAHGVKVWIAPDSIPAGEDWNAAIISGIERATHFLVILTAASVRSEWVLKEIDLAKQRYEETEQAKKQGVPYSKFAVLPLVVGKLSDYPDGEFMNSLQHVPYRQDISDQLKAIVTALNVPAGRKQIVSESLAALLLTCILLSANWLANRTDLGKAFQLTAYNVLQHRLSSTYKESDLPIAVVDISDLDRSAIAGTSRPVLQSLINAVVESRPRAIGIDIDFSPIKNRYITAEDPAFFQFCLETKRNTGVPIFLGIYHSLPLPSSAWLGESKYQELAAAIIIPNDTRKMPRWLQIDDNPQRSFSISASLAGAYRNSIATPGIGLGWAVEPESDIEQKYFSGKDFLVDFGPLEAIEGQRLRTINPVVIRDQGRQLHDKIVIFGDATLGQAADTFTVPGRREPVPSILIHACAVYTLLKEPLYVLTKAGQLAIDLLLALLVFGGITIIRGSGRNRVGQITAANHNIAALMGAFLVIFVGWGLVRATRLIWDDFLVVAFVLLVYASLWPVWSKIRRSIGKVAHASATQTIEETHS